jgi:hypothetical protein
MTLSARCGSSVASDLYAVESFSYEIPIAQAFASSRFFMAVCPLIDCARMSFKNSSHAGAGAMLFDQNHEEHLCEVQGQIGRAHAITPELMFDVIARACLRLQVQHPTAKARVARLIELGAFVDATFAVLELELPQWKLRRLIYEDGEWHCSLSKHIGLPASLDELAEASHESQPLAILSALLEARRNSLAAAESRPQSVPQARSTRGYAICCDNFA